MLQSDGTATTINPEPLPGTIEGEVDETPTRNNLEQIDDTKDDNFYDTRQRSGLAPKQPKPRLRKEENWFSEI